MILNRCLHLTLGYFPGVICPLIYQLLTFYFIVKQKMSSKVVRQSRFSFYRYTIEVFIWVDIFLKIYDSKRSRVSVIGDNNNVFHRICIWCQRPYTINRCQSNCNSSSITNKGQNERLNMCLRSFVVLKIFKICDQSIE